MTWTVPRPQMADKKIDEQEYARELYDRFKPFGSVTVGAILVAANATTDTTLTLTSGSGVRVGMAVVMNAPTALPSGVVYGGTIATATDTLVLRLGNCSATPQTVSSGSWSYGGVII